MKYLQVHFPTDIYHVRANLLIVLKASIPACRQGTVLRYKLCLLSSSTHYSWSFWFIHPCIRKEVWFPYLIPSPPKPPPPSITSEIFTWFLPRELVNIPSEILWENANTSSQSSFALTFLQYYLRLSFPFSSILPYLLLILRTDTLNKVKFDSNYRKSINIIPLLTWSLQWIFFCNFPIYYGWKTERLRPSKLEIEG